MNEKELRELRADYAETFGTRNGKRVLWHLLQGCHLFSPTYTGDALSGAFREGERNVGLRILSMMDMGGEDGLKKIQDLKEKENTDERGNAPFGGDG